MSASKEVVEEKVTVKTLIWVAVLSIVMAFFWNFFEALLPPSARCTQRVNTLLPTPGTEFVGGPFVALLVVMALQYFQPLRKYLTKTNLTYLSIAMITTSFYTHFATVQTRNTMFLLIRVSASDVVARYTPEFFMLPRDVSEMLLRGVGDLGVLPWSILLSAILWRFLLIVLFAGVGIGISNIFRREWIDVEKLPFPYITVVQTCLTNVESIVKKERTSKTPFFMGMLIGILLGIPLSGATLFPWFPDLYMWRSDTCGPGSHWIAPPDVPWHLGLAKHPPMHAFMLLVPLHALFSALFYTLIAEIAFFIAYYGFGYYTGVTATGFCGRNWCGSISLYSAPPLYLSTVTSGAALGLFVITIILERRYIVETLRYAFRKSEEFGKREPMSYRSSWTLIALSYLGLMVFLIYTGLSPWLSFVIPLVGIITWMVLTQVWARIGFIIEACYDFTPAMIRLLAWPTQYYPEVTGTDYVLVPALSIEWIGHTAGGSVEGGGGWGASFFTSLSSYKMAGQFGIHPRDALKILVISMVIATFITCFNQIAIPGLFGLTRLGYSLCTPNFDTCGNFWDRPLAAPLSEGFTHLTVGFIFMVVMRYLYTRFMWMPDPLLAIVAWSWEISLHGLWFACLTAFVIKSIILKIGGSKLYEEWVVPFVGGFMIGYTLEVLLAVAVNFILFPPLA